MLILNFIGIFGEIEAPNEINSDDFYTTFKSNLDPIFRISSVYNEVAEKSLWINFSGGGVGGNSSELIAPSYVVSKTSIVILTELLSKIYEGKNKYIVCIAPGAFPSKMQEAVLHSSKILISSRRKNQADNTLHSVVDRSNLINLLSLAFDNSHLVNGKLLSANFDTQQDFSNSHFGLLRRVVK